MDSPVEAPPVRWFFGDAPRRRVAWEYWVLDVFWGLFYSAGHHLMRLVSIDTCSRMGDAFGDIARRHVGFRIGGLHRYRAHEARARRNWALLRPRDTAPGAVEAAMDGAFRNSGRSYAEFSMLERLWSGGRIEVRGEEHVAAARATGRPTIVAGLHLGNWETLGPALVGLGYPVRCVYQTPPNRFYHRSVVAARHRFGMKLVPPGPGGARFALRSLTTAGELLLIYVDECVDGHVYAPFLGRPAEAKGNIANVVRLAALANAIVVPGYAIRLNGASFRVTFLPPVPLRAGADRQADAAANVVAMNAVIEPVVRAHLDQWLWLFDLRLDT